MKLRDAVRALITTPDDDLLLVHFVFQKLTFWAPPGGGIEGDESPPEALARELFEETGLRDAVPGPLVYVHERAYLGPNDSDWFGQRDVVHLVEVPRRFEPRPEILDVGLRAENIGALRWFSPAELPALTLLPRALPQVLASWRAGERRIHRFGIGECDAPG